MAKMPALGPSMGVPNKPATKFGAATKLNSSSYKLKGMKSIKTKSVRKKRNISAKGK